jgi:hypothetical protein
MTVDRRSPRAVKGLLAAVLVAAAIPPAVIGAAPFQHERWDKLLKANVTPDGYVDYGSLKGKDSAELKAYLNEIANADPETLGDKNDKKAFWINAYNAVCIQLIIDARVPATVPHAVLFGENIFTQRTYKVAGALRSLDDIEHRILRKDFKDPRIHAAVVCGAQSCPRLRPAAFTGANLDAELEEECRSWVAVEKTKKGERKNSLDQKDRVYRVSRIFDWYEEDFGGSSDGVLAFLKKYSDEADRAFLEKNKVRLEHLPYDWSVNSR